MTPAPDDMALREPREQTISERLDHIEHMLKFIPLPWYRQELIREYLDLTTDPEERHERA